MDLFADEVEDLYLRCAGSGITEKLEREASLLLIQAFRTELPASDFRTVSDGWRRSIGNADPRLTWLSGLVDAARKQTLGPKLYFSQRRQVSRNELELSLLDIVSQVHSLVRKLYNSDYFGQALGVECQAPYADPQILPEAELARLINKPNLWDGDLSLWAEADLFDFIEVFHDLAARPIDYWFCFDCCNETHPGEYSRKSGQVLYRGLVNQLLEKTPLRFRIAGTGEDVGRMVQAAHEGLEQLVDEMLEGQSSAKVQISHAVATFRQREGTVEQRRSAIVALAGILEERRELLRDKLIRKDEGALFQIANDFNIRHQSEQQKKDYDPAFLDWIFYWYLATIQLTDRLLAQSNGTPPT